MKLQMKPEMKSLSLREVQKEFFNSVLNQNTSQELKKWITPKPSLSIENRVKIYQDAYRVRIHESINDDFMELKSQVGSKRFDSIVQSFVKENPSKVKNLAEFSRQFSDYLSLKYPDFKDAGLIAWTEIVSNYLPDPENILSTDQITLNDNCIIVVHPACQILKLENKINLFHRMQDEIQRKFLTEIEYDFFEFLSIDRSLQEITSYIEDHKINSNQLLCLISDWLANSIIYCKKI